MAPIAIEGMIGSGKSTTVEILKHMTNLRVQPEPVEAWTPFLDAAYEGGSGHVALQVRIMLDTCRRPPDTDIVERSPEWQPLTFVPAMVGNGTFSFIRPDEGDMLKELHADLMRWKPRGTIFLWCSKEEALRRIVSRNRGAEKQLERSYLLHLHELYDAALKIFPRTEVIDTTGKSPAQVAAEVYARIQLMGT